MATKLKDAILARQSSTRRKQWHEKLPPRMKREIDELAAQVKSGELVAPVSLIHNVLLERFPGQVPAETMLRKYFREYTGTEQAHGKAKVGGGSGEAGGRSAKRAASRKSQATRSGR